MRFLFSVSVFLTLLTSSVRTGQIHPCDQPIQSTFEVTANISLPVSWCSDTTMVVDGKSVPATYSQFTVMWNGSPLVTNIGTSPAPYISAPVGAPSASGKQQWATMLFFGEGTHKVKIIAHRIDSSGNRVDSPASAELTVVAKVSTTLPMSITLINVDTKQPVPGFDPILPDTTIDAAKLPSRNINYRINTSGTSAVSGSINSTTFTDSTAPFYVYGDVNGVPNGRTISIGAHTIAISQLDQPLYTLQFNVADIPPVEDKDCQGTWSEWTVKEDWGSCVNGQQSRTLERVFTKTQDPSGNGKPCPGSPETKTETRSCTVVIDVPAPVFTNCRWTLVGVVPDTTGGWRGRWREDGVSVGPIDTTSPYDRIFSYNRGVVKNVDIVWSKNNTTETKTSPAILLSCK